MAISIKLKKRWDVYPTLQEVLTATQNLSVSPFGTTIDDDLQDFRGIKLIGKGECINVSLSNSDFSGSLWQNFQIAETETFTPRLKKKIFLKKLKTNLLNINFLKKKIDLCITDI